MNSDDYRNLLDDLYGDPDDDESEDSISGKAVVVDYLPGERVRLKGADPDAWGFVTGVIVRESGILYMATWPCSRSDSQHFAFELEGAE